MSSGKQAPNALASADQQLASMSLDDGAAGGAGDGDDDDDKFCSNCGKTGDDLKGCNSCRCIRYCSAKCQKKHWKHHKVDCRRIKAALSDKTRPEYCCVDLTEARMDISGLFDQPPPPPDCAICMMPVPIYESDGTSMSAHAPCCGTIICHACDFEACKAKAMLNIKRKQKKQPPMRHCCEFCRAPIGIDVSDKEMIRICTDRYKGRAEKNDHEAIWELAGAHRNRNDTSRLQVPFNEEKALELAKRAADLGNDKAQLHLGLWYEQGHLGLNVDKERARDLWESAAKGGNVKARFALGRDECSKGDIIDGVRHLHIAAASGYSAAMDALILFFERGLLRHKDLAKSLRAKDKACLDMRSDSRDRYLAQSKANR